MIVLVCGGREFNDYERVKEVLDDVLAGAPDGHTRIINGGARGADQLSTRWAKERGEEWIEVPVAKNREEQAKLNAPSNWDDDGNIAGFLRNQAMLDRHNPDFGVAFPGDNGTADMLVRLFRAGVETRVVGGKR